MEPKVSGDDQDAIVGKLTREYSALSQSRSMVAETLHEIGKEVSAVAEKLRAGSFEAASTLMTDELVAKAGLERLRKLLDEHAELSKHASVLRGKLASMGIRLDA